MEYDEQTDAYTCKNNKKLIVDHTKHNISKTGDISKKTIYRCEDCSDCSYKRNCLKGNNCKTPLEERTKVLNIAKNFVKQRQE